MTDRSLVLLSALVLLILFSIVTGILLVDLAEDGEASGKLYTFPVSVEEKTYVIRVRSNCSSEPEVSYFGPLKSVLVNSRGGRETVFFDLTIPANLIWGELSIYKQGSKQNGNQYTLSSNGTHHSVQMTLNHVAMVEQISIEGTEGAKGISHSTVTPKLLWKFTLPRYIEYYYKGTPQYALPRFASLAVADGVVYISASGGPDQGLYALDAESGTKIWNYTYENMDDVSHPRVVNGVVYINSRDNLYAFDAHTGAELWDAYFFDLYSSSPAVIDGVVYIGAGDGNVHALSASNGTEIWTHSVGKSSTDWPFYGTFSAPTVADGVVYIGSQDCNLYALNAANGAKIWNYTTRFGIDAAPTVVNGVVYFGSGDGNVYALNSADGTKIWNYTTFQSENNGNWIVTTPAVVDGVVYIGSENDIVYALNATNGAKIWNYTTGNDIFSSPAVIDGVVYTGSEDGNVYALDATNGVKLWNYTTEGLIHSSPALANGVLYIGGYYGSVYALGDLPMSSQTSRTITGVAVIAILVPIATVLLIIFANKRKIEKPL